MKRIAPVAIGVALAGALASVPLQAQVPARAVTDFSYSPVTPGSWTYREVAGGSEATFVDTTGTARAVMTCGKVSRLVTISRVSPVPAASISIWTSSASRDLASRFDLISKRVVSQFGGWDSFLDAIAFSRGRIAMSMPGSPALVLPAGTELAHIVEDCRA
ncbi:MAG: hypothetical protein HOP96_10505 [Sphingomonas sp.]|nr:hypothetical protein [Sphingomonas sp.]